MYGQQQTQTSTEVFRELRKRGLSRVVVSFSGGNDEGGIDTVTGYDANGEQVDDHGIEYIWLTTDGKVGWGQDARDATPQEKADAQLWDALGGPIFAKYGSFAGEFSVYGEVVWDVATGKTTMSGQESFESYDDFEEEL